MRVLVGCSMGGNGHLMPLLGVAAALCRQGHDCTLLAPPSLADAASGAGLRVVVGAEPSREFVDGLWERVRAGPADRVVGLIDRELFAGRATDVMRDAARGLLADLDPGLVVRESCEYATAMAAHEAHVVQVQVGISPAAIDHAVLCDVADSLDGRCPGVADAIADAPYLTAFPAPLDPSPWTDTRRYRLPSPAAARLPDWWSTMKDRPLVYLTFGSVLGGLAEARSVYRTALDAVAELPVRGLLTVGHRFDIATLGAVPDNTRVEPWVSQSDVLTAADLVVCHGGSGTVNATLTAGVPLVVCPLFADQTANAASVDAVGAGLVVRSHQSQAGGVATLDRQDAGMLKDAISNGLQNSAYRDAAQQTAARIATAPTVDQVARGIT